MKDFGAELYALRVRRGMSQRQLASTAKLSPSTVSEVENGRRAPPCLAVVKRLSAALGLVPDEQLQFRMLAEQGRKALGLRISSKIPKEVSDLIREIALSSDRLTKSQIHQIRKNLETPMT